MEGVRTEQQTDRCEGTLERGRKVYGVYACTRMYHGGDDTGVEPVGRGRGMRKRELILLDCIL